MAHLVPTAGFLLLLNCLFQLYAMHVGKQRGISLTSVTVRAGTATPISSRRALFLRLLGRFPSYFFCTLTLAFPELLASTAFGAAFCGGVAVYLVLTVLTRTEKYESARSLLVVDALLYLAPALCYAMSAASWLVI